MPKDFIVVRAETTGLRPVSSRASRYQEISALTCGMRVLDEGKAEPNLYSPEPCTSTLRVMQSLGPIEAEL